jgi:hypothetical protein
MQRRSAVLRASVLFVLVGCSGGSASAPEGAAGSAGANGSAGVNGSAGAKGGAGSSGSGGTAAAGGTAADDGSAAGTAGQGGNASDGGGSGGSSAGESGSGGTAPDPNCGTNAWACWRMPNPTGSGLPNEAVYTDNGDGTVRDHATGLIWQKRAPAGTFTWDQALAYCADLALGGHDDWRVPTRIELTSITDFTRSGAKLDPSAFPGESGGFHKTSSDWILTIEQRGAGRGRDFAWAFNMSDGIVSNARSKATQDRVRCVRGNDAGVPPSTPAVRPRNQYTLLSDDEVVDNYTGLVWQRGSSAARSGWDVARQYCASLGLGGKSWRLPTIRELSTLVDEAQVAPSIDRQVFPGTAYGARSNDWYWASHQAVGASPAAWALNFDDGFTGFNSGRATGSDIDWNYFTEAWARCVR